MAPIESLFIEGYVDAISRHTKADGSAGNNSLMLSTTNLWYSLKHKDAQGKRIEDLVEKGDYVQIQYTVSDKQLLIMEIKQIAEGEAKREAPKNTNFNSSKSNSKFGDIIGFDTLLNDAHLKGLIDVDTECLFVDWDKKIAAFKAIVKMKSVDEKTKEITMKTFVGHGDACADNISQSNVKMAWYRMSETRSLVRALKLATNNAENSDEDQEVK